MKFVIFIVAMLFSSIATAHEMTPAYIKLAPSSVDDIYVATFKMLNRRVDVDYYAINAYDVNWNKIPFASFNRVFKLEHLKRIDLKIFFQKKYFLEVYYICTESKLYEGKGTYIASRICSRIDR
tara:strand:- start:1665 stop:2036 length:372 start_codon:yes stop_codon:yes gene_type:complete